MRAQRQAELNRLLESQNAERIDREPDQKAPDSKMYCMSTAPRLSGLHRRIFCSPAAGIASPCKRILDVARPYIPQAVRQAGQVPRRGTAVDIVSPHRASPPCQCMWSTSFHSLQVEIPRRTICGWRVRSATDSRVPKPAADRPICSGERGCSFRSHAGRYGTSIFGGAKARLRIEGISPTGRATVVALRMNNEHLVRARRRWVLAGWHPPS
jgi:hypothetical protein